jgi:hypothetical protein
VNLGGFGESFYNVIACFYGNGYNLKVVFSSSVRGEVYTLRYLCLDGLTVSGTRLRRVRDVDMKRDFAFVVCTLFLCCSLSLSLSRNFVYFISTCTILYMFCKYDLLFVLFSIAVDYRNLVTHEMLKMQYML